MHFAIPHSTLIRKFWQSSSDFCHTQMFSETFEECSEAIPSSHEYPVIRLFLETQCLGLAPSFPFSFAIRCEPFRRLMQRRRGCALTGQPLCPRLRLEVVWSYQAVLGDLPSFWFVCLWGLLFKRFLFGKPRNGIIQIIYVCIMYVYTDIMCIYIYIYTHTHMFSLSFGRDCFWWTEPSLNKRCFFSISTPPQAAVSLAGWAWALWLLGCTMDSMDGREVPRNSQGLEVPQNGWFRLENPMEMDYLGVPLF